MIKKDLLIRTEYPDTKTTTEMVCHAHREILKTIAKSE
jgi:hypothetical protein